MQLAIVDNHRVLPGVRGLMPVALPRTIGVRLRVNIRQITGFWAQPYVAAVTIGEPRRRELFADRQRLTNENVCGVEDDSLAMM
jgi:hypothetical protein